ncbi:MAG: hypothetical protein LBS69_06525 [Prevotellaceae bacterium]|jgi:hypothetical protein|nr:hypothetical protein [Prevotellaceae bacterium]
MKNLIKKSTLLFGMIVLCCNIFAQPKPWTFGENVVISPNLYTGTMRLAIPFYTYKDADFEIPVSFGYSSSGCVANVRGGIMGPGWGLNVGGSITREIRGVPDENYYAVNKLYGFYFLHKTNTINSYSIFIMLNYLFRCFLIPGHNISSNPHNSNIEQSTPTIMYSSYNDISSAPFKYDAEPDIFHFNFMGYSGTFHLGFNNSIHVYNTNIDNKNLKIEIEENNTNEHIFAIINIYTPSGYKYIFDCNRQSKSVIFSQTIGDNDTPDQDNKGEIITWNLTRIVTPSGRTVIFDYEQKIIINYIPSSFYLNHNNDKYNYWANACNVNGWTLLGTPIPVNREEHKFYKHVTYMSIIKAVTINNESNNMIADIKFNYYTPTTGNKDQYRANKSSLKEINDESVLLSSITVNSKLNGITVKVKECNLNYKRNTNGARTNYLDYITIQGDGTYSMAYHNWNDNSYPYPANGTFSVDHWGYYNGKNNDNSTSLPFLNISSLDTDLNEYINSFNRNHNTNYAKCGMLNQITYPAGGRYTSEYESHDYNKAIKRSSSNSFIPQIVNTSGTCGGLRVNVIKNYSNNDNSSLISTRTYTYKNSNNTGSGILLNKPRYHIKYSATLSTIQGIYIRDDNMKLWSTDINAFSNNHIEYSKVQEILNDGSVMEYSFTNSTMPGYMDTIKYYYTLEKNHYLDDRYGTWSVNNPNYTHTTLNNIVAPVSSKQFIRGRLLSTKVFSSKSSSIPLYSETNTYENTYTNSQTYIPHYYVRALGYMPVYTGKYNAQSTTQTQHANGVEVSKTNSCTYNSYGQVASQTTTDSKGITQTVEYRYVTDTTTNANGSRVIDLMAKHNVINLPLREEVFVIENGVKTRIGGRRYTYFVPVSSKPAMIRLQQIDVYDSETGSWITDAKYNVYDNCGNLLEMEDSNGLKTSYVYGYKGLYKIAEISNCSFSQVKGVSGLSNIQTNPLNENMTATTETALRNILQAEVTTFDYQPLVGLVKIKDSTGRSVSYLYNKHGKLEKVLNTAGEPEIRYNYSTDNN